MKLLQELSVLAEAKQPLGFKERSKQTKKDPEQQTHFTNSKGGDTFDPANPYHQDEKKRRDAEEKARKASHKAASTKFPKIPGEEFGRRLFDEDMVNYLKNEIYGKKVWDKMTELEQIKAQLDVVGDIRAPAFKGDVAKFEDHLDRVARKLQSQIKRDIKEATHRVPAGTFQSIKVKKSDQETDFYNNKFDPANPYHQDEKKRRDNIEAAQPKYTLSDLKAKAKAIVKQIKADYDKGGYDEIGPSDLIDHYVDFQKDNRLWNAVDTLLMGFDERDIE